MFLTAVVLVFAGFVAVWLVDRLRRARGGRLARRHNGTVMFACDQCSAKVTGLDRPTALAWAHEHATQHHPDPTATHH